MIKPQLDRLFLITVCSETLLSAVLFILEADTELAAALVGFFQGEKHGFAEEQADNKL